MSDAFLQRWSKRKQQQSEALTQPLPEEALAPDQQPVTETSPELPDQQTDEEIELPDVDSLHAGSDVSMFFSSKVSAELKQQALRKLFHQPEFNVRCPLDEYAEDYSQMPLLSAEAAGKVRQWAKEQIEDLLDNNTAADKNTTDDEQTHHDRTKHQPSGTETSDQQLATTTDDPEQQHQLPE